MCRLQEGNLSFWGSDVSKLVPISEKEGFPVVDMVTALGLDWSLTGTKASHKKETAMIAETKLRLERLKHLPGDFLLKTGLASTGCWSLIDYGLPPSLGDVPRLSGSVKRALTLAAGAPEIVLNMSPSSTLSAELRWILVQLRFWHGIAKQSDAKDLLIRSEKNSLNIKFLGGIFLGHPGPRRWDIPDKTLCKWPFSVVLDREWPGCPGFRSGRPGFGKTLCKQTLG